MCGVGKCAVGGLGVSGGENDNAQEHEGASTASLWLLMVTVRTAALVAGSGA